MTNTGFVALPVLQAIYGPHAVLPAAIATVFVAVVMFPAAVILLELGQRAIGRSLRKSAADVPEKRFRRQRREHFIGVLLPVAGATSQVYRYLAISDPTERERTRLVV